MSSLVRMASPGRSPLASVVLVAILLCLSRPACGWGPDGHEITAILASERLSPAAAAAVQALLGANVTMANVSTWADNQRYLPGWEWSVPLHYIDTPDWACDYVAARDCPDGACVANAIANYTGRIVNQTDLVQRQEALYFLIHFCGDIHQPLHVSFASDWGGNLLNGTFFGNWTNLHSIWDENMIIRRMTLDFQGSQAAFAKYLSALSDSQFQQDPTKWEAPPCYAVPGGPKTSECVAAWANEGARLCCSRGETVPGGNHVTNLFALGQDYYATRIPIVEQRLIQGGRRLANLLNAIFDGGHVDSATRTSS